MKTYMHQTGCACATLLPQQPCLEGIDALRSHHCASSLSDTSKPMVCQTIGFAWGSPSTKTTEITKRHRELGRLQTRSRVLQISKQGSTPAPWAWGSARPNPNKGTPETENPLRIGFTVLRGRLRPWSRKGLDPSLLRISESQKPRNVTKTAAPRIF